jgi:hypothetical protein
VQKLPHWDFGQEDGGASLRAVLHATPAGSAASTVTECRISARRVRDFLQQLICVGYARRNVKSYNHFRTFRVG